MDGEVIPGVSPRSELRHSKEVHGPWVDPAHSGKGGWNVFDCAVETWLRGIQGYKSDPDAGEYPGFNDPNLCATPELGAEWVI